MTPARELGNLVRAGSYDFRPGNGGDVHKLFCSRCGGFKPHCGCNTFMNQLEMRFQQ